MKCHTLKSWILPPMRSDPRTFFVCVEVLQPSQPNGVMSSAVSSPSHKFTGQAYSSKRLTSIVHILSPETDNCPSWISGRERMTVENISWSISTKECRRGLNPRPPGLQSDSTSNWATEAGSPGPCDRKSEVQTPGHTDTAIVKNLISKDIYMWVELNVPCSLREEYRFTLHGHGGHIWCGFPIFSSFERFCTKDTSSYAIWPLNYSEPWLQWQNLFPKMLPL